MGNSGPSTDLEDLPKTLADRDAEIMKRDTNTKCLKESYQVEVNELCLLINFFENNKERLSKEIRDMKGR